MATTTKRPVNATAKELVTESADFLAGMEGDGFEDMGANATGIAYLGLVQPDSTVEDEDNPAGTWRNSATGKNYGSNIRVVAIAFRTIWSEREADAPFRTVGRYPVNGIPVEIRQPPKGKKGFPKMINPDTGNEVQELFVYAVMLPDFPEDGVLYFNPTAGNMKTCKNWNSQLKGQILPNGTQAPLFAYTWNLLADLVPNPQQPNKQVARFAKVIRDALVTEDFFVNHAKPQIALTKQAVLQITSGAVTDEEEA